MTDAPTDWLVVLACEPERRFEAAVALRDDAALARAWHTTSNPSALVWLIGCAYGPRAVLTAGLCVVAAANRRGPARDRPRRLAALRALEAALRDGRELPPCREYADPWDAVWEAVFWSRFVGYDHTVYTNVARGSVFFRERDHRRVAAAIARAVPAPRLAQIVEVFARGR